MARTVAIGYQEFDDLIRDDCFYVDKTLFIKEWWENKDRVTLITRPRRFGKTLTMNMVKEFFSIEKKGSKLFQGLDIWKEEKYRKLQGTYPVIFLSFADVKENNFADTKEGICDLISQVCGDWKHLLDTTRFQEQDIAVLNKISDTNLSNFTIKSALKRLSKLLNRYYGKKVIILLDEYDTPMQEAYVNGYWDELTDFMRGFFNSTFKTNPYLERALLTGITRVSKESMFSDLNNPEVVTTTSEKYETVFGFTEEEVFQALEVYGLSDTKDQVKEWYDGFVFGKCKHIYNPWSIIHFLKKKKFAPYWVNTSSNPLISNIIRKSNINMKLAVEDLMQGKSITAQIDEEIVFNYLDESEEAVWSLFLAGGYLKINKIESDHWDNIYDLVITNYEVQQMFRQMVRGWFAKEKRGYNDFLNALLTDDVKKMNEYLEGIVNATFSYFDVGQKPAENFYHAFVLGLIADLRGRYEITSNRESGEGRYDVMLAPKNETDNGIMIEFKVFKPEKEKSLKDIVERALAQIEERKYETSLLERGISVSRIKKYGFAFKGQEVLVGSSTDSRSDTKRRAGCGKAARPVL